MVQSLPCTAGLSTFLCDFQGFLQANFQAQISKGKIILLFSFVYSTRLGKGISRQLDIYILTAHYANNSPIVFQNYSNCLVSNQCFPSKTLFSSALLRSDIGSSQEDSVTSESPQVN